MLREASVPRLHVMRQSLVGMRGGQHVQRVVLGRFSKVKRRHRAEMASSGIPTMNVSEQCVPKVGRANGYSREEVAEHCTPQDCWLIHEDKAGAGLRQLMRPPRTRSAPTLAWSCLR